MASAELPLLTTLQRDDVDLITDAITELTSDGVRTADGNH
ncbi:hypothetical protein N602_29040 [Mycobacterium avium subsp. hominissuis 10-5606]|nr:hypothetical protein N602_29040 [Mycobacterium avium subsp. hominissuis 10-5606]